MHEQQLNRSKAAQPWFRDQKKKPNSDPPKLTKSILCVFFYRRADLLSFEVLGALPYFSEENRQGGQFSSFLGVVGGGPKLAVRVPVNHLNYDLSLRAQVFCLQPGYSISTPFSTVGLRELLCGVRKIARKTPEGRDVR